MSNPKFTWERNIVPTADQVFAFVGTVRSGVGMNRNFCWSPCATFWGTNSAHVDDVGIYQNFPLPVAVTVDSVAEKGMSLVYLSNTVPRICRLKEETDALFEICCCFCDVQTNFKKKYVKSRILFFIFSVLFAVLPPVVVHVWVGLLENNIYEPWSHDQRSKSD